MALGMRRDGGPDAVFFLLFTNVAKLSVMIKTMFAGTEHSHMGVLV